ncbi:hypothetical protein J7L49_00795 [Candidatus Bathyarchaeota archaeon]|nr:hypothetical protein [Candidatus Bathyarchaeota archaeon]
MKNLKIDENLKNIIEKGADFHGHLGPFLVLGIKAGLTGLKEIGKPKKFGHVHAEIKLKFSVPYSCFIDGVQFTTKCTVGNQLLKIEKSRRKEITVNFEGENSEKKLTIQVKPEIINYLMEQFAKGTSNEELAWKIASLPEEKIFFIKSIK